MIGGLRSIGKGTYAMIVISNRDVKMIKLEVHGERTNKTISLTNNKWRSCLREEGKR